MSSHRIANREQVTAFRLCNHHLAERLPAGSLLEAAGACGIQNTPPGSADLALHARVTGLSPRDVRQALAIDKTLLQAWSLRGAPYVFPAGEAAVFTRGLLPDDEESLRAFVLGLEQALGVIGMSATELVTRVGQALDTVLDGRVLANKRILDQEIARAVEGDLDEQQLAAWHRPSWYGPNQTIGEAAVSFALRPLSLAGRICFAPREGSEASFVRADQWLGQPLSDVAADQAANELVRRYLHCYGPSSAADFAAWAGICERQAGVAWHSVADELVTISFAGRDVWLLASDLAQFASPMSASGVRLLPPHDPYLLLRDRRTLVPDKWVQKRLWGRTGNPGVVLVDGELVAVWRPNKQGKRFNISVEWLAQEQPGMVSGIEAEGASLGAYRDCSAVEVSFSDVSGTIS